MSDWVRTGEPDALVRGLDGLLFFPVTAFDEEGRFNPETYRQHVRTGIEGGAAAVFACCGTGEFFALDIDDYAAALTVAVEEAAGRMPVVGGVGYGTALAKRYAQAAEQAGVDGLLVMPPYLVYAGQDGLRRHLGELAASTRLALILYQRDNAILSPETVAELSERPNIVGLKDGYGDLDHLHRIISGLRTAVGAGTGAKELLYLNGMPTAEMTQPAYRALGVNVYSSAVYCFAPNIAMAFWKAISTGDDATVRALTDAFYSPLVRLRDQGSGYAVSLVKAGVRMRGLDVGTVRAPLAEPKREHVERLAQLIEAGNRVVEDR
jgi:5-dehydro-4-deoxyglucarate dehydratase